MNRESNPSRQRLALQICIIWWLEETYGIVNKHLSGAVSMLQIIIDNQRCEMINH